MNKKYGFECKEAAKETTTTLEIVTALENMELGSLCNIMALQEEEGHSVFHLTVKHDHHHVCSVIHAELGSSSISAVSSSPEAV